ncbi:MAG: hypothetical protein ACOCP8_08725 [archaeon]
MNNWKKISLKELENRFEDHYFMLNPDNITDIFIYKDKPIILFIVDKYEERDSGKRIVKLIYSDHRYEVNKSLRILQGEYSNVKSIMDEFIRAFPLSLSKELVSRGENSKYLEDL